MIKVSQEYINACKKPTRESYFVITYGNINEIKQFIKYANSKEAQPFSNIDQTYDSRSVGTNFISCEPNRIKLDGSYTFLNSKFSNKQYIGWWSKELSNKNGLFTNNPYVTYIFSKENNCINTIIYFQEVVKSLKIYYYLDDTLIYEYLIENNNKLNIETEINDFPLNSKFNELKIEFIKTKEPYRYVKLSEIDFGSLNILQFSNNDIKSIDIINEISIDSSNSMYNSLNVNIIDKNNEYNINNPYSKLNIFAKKGIINVYYFLKVLNKFEQISIGNYLINKVNNMNNQLILECYDRTYFMNEVYYGSKIYTNERVSIILEDLFNYYKLENKIDYEIDEKLSGVTLSGYILPCNFREALRLVAEACMSTIIVDRYGIIHVKSIDYNSTSVNQFTKNLNTLETTSSDIIETIEINEYSLGNILTDVLFEGKINKGINYIKFNHTPINYDKYKNDLDAFFGHNYYIKVLSFSAFEAIINYELDNPISLKLEGEYFEDQSKVHRIRLNNNIEEKFSNIITIDNHLIQENNYLNVARWRLNQSNVKYNISCASLPYIENGDLCTLDTGFKYNNGTKVIKKFIINKVEFTQSLKEYLEGE